MAVREDVFGYDAVSLVIDRETDPPIFIQPGTPGWRELLRSLHERLPGIEPRWYERMMKDPFPCFERVLYEREPAPEGTTG